MNKATKFESVLARKEKFITLGDIFDENNQIKYDFKIFLAHFSKNINRVFVSIIEYGIIRGLVNHNVEIEIPIFLRESYLQNFSNYLNHDGYISYSISGNQSIGEDYNKIDKRNDFIVKISILDRDTHVLFGNCADINPIILKKFKIMCTRVRGGKYERNIDLVEYWDKFDNDDEIIINGILEPREPFIENLSN